MNRAARRRAAAQARKARTGYLHRVLAAQHLLKGRAGVRRVVVAHDPDCDIYKGASCTCVPDISIHSGDKIITVDVDGYCKERVLS